MKFFNEVLGAGIVTLMCLSSTVLAIGQLDTISLLHPFDISVNHTAAGSIHGVAVSPHGDLIFASRSTIISGVFTVQDPNTAVINSALPLVSSPGIGCSDAPSMDMSASPKSVTLMSDKMVAVTDMMFSSRIWGLSVPYGSSFPDAVGSVNVSKLVGANCSFDQGTNFQNRSSTSSKIAPPDFVTYYGASNMLFFTQNMNIAAVHNGLVYSWLGTSTRATRPMSKPLPTARWETATNYPGQMTFDGNTMYVAEQSGMIRSIDLDSGTATWVLGVPTMPGSWPPPDCVATPCTVNNFYILQVEALVFARLANQTKYLFFVDKVQSILFAYDFTEVRAIAGEPLRPRSPPVPGRLSGGSQIAIHGDALYIADGNIRRFNLTTPALAPPLPSGCTIVDHCNGRAWDVHGLPATGCVCVCRGNWTGAACTERLDDATHTLTLSHSLEKTKTEHRISRTVLIEETPAPTPEPAIPEEIVESATTTASVAVTVVAVMNPTVAVQGARSTLLLRVGRCNPNFGEELDWVQNVLKLALGDDNMRWYRGAAVGNVVAILAFASLLGAIGFAVAQRKRYTLISGLAFVRFPGLTAFPILFVFEGLVMAGTVLLLHGSGLDWLPGILSVLIALAIFGFMFLQLHYRFDSSFISNEKYDDSPTGCKGRAKWVFMWLFWETGKWENTFPDQFRKRYGGFFRDYREHRQEFILAEFAMCLMTGALDGVHPNKGTKCVVVVCLMAAAYIAMFLSILIFKPYVQRLARFLALAVAGLQAVSAVQLVALVLTNDPDWERASGSFALASIYVLAIDGVLSLLDLLRQISYFVWKKCRREHSETSSDQSGLLSQPMLDGGMGDRRDFYPAEELASFSGSTNNSGDINNNASFASPLPGRSFAADPRLGNVDINASFGGNNLVNPSFFGKSFAGEVPSFTVGNGTFSRDENTSFGLPGRQASALEDPFDDLPDTREGNVDQHQESREQLLRMKNPLDMPSSLTAPPQMAVTYAEPPNDDGRRWKDPMSHFSSNATHLQSRSVTQGAPLTAFTKDGRTGMTPLSMSSGKLDPSTPSTHERVASELLSNVSFPNGQIGNHSFGLGSVMGTDSTPSASANQSFRGGNASTRSRPSPGTHSSLVSMPQIPSSQSGDTMMDRSSGSLHQSFARTNTSTSLGIPTPSSNNKTPSTNPSTVASSTSLFASNRSFPSPQFPSPGVASSTILSPSTGPLPFQRKDKKDKYQ